MNPNFTSRCFENDHIVEREGLPATEWASIGINVILMIGICLGNGLIITAFIRLWKLITLSRYLILQLAMAGFVLGLSLLYNSLAKVLKTKLMHSHNLCSLVKAFHTFPGAASVIGIQVITCNRYLAVVRHPLTYQDNPSLRYYVIYTLIIWIPSAIFGFVLPMMWHNHCPAACKFTIIMTTSFLKYMFMPFFVLMAFPMTALYVHLFVTAKKHLRNITDSVSQPSQPSGQPQEGVHIKGQIKILKAGFLLFTTFYISWLPYLFIMGIQLYSGQMKQESPMTTARFLSMSLIPLNSLANPLIYAYKLPHLKRELSTMFLNCRKKCSSS